MRHSPLFPAVLSLLLAGGCDDPADTVREVVEARGSCTEDSLRVSSETCVRMFGRYAEMITDGMHSYIGGMKAMDRAIQRLPPADFDTAGLGRAITLPPAAFSADSAAPRFSPTARGAREAPDPRDYGPPYDEPAGAWEEPYDEYAPGYGDYAPGGYERGPRSPVYDRRPLGERGAEAPPPPAPRRGVLLPPGSRLGRPWLGEDDRLDERDRIMRECEGSRARECEEPGDYREDRGW